MAKKLTSGASLLGANDQVADKPKQLKFISKNGTQVFVVPVRDRDGNQKIKTDARGNNPMPEYKTHKFIKIEKEGADKIREVSSFFIADPDRLGAEYDDVVAVLTELCKRPAISGIYTEDDWFKNRNPEAYRIAKDREALQSQLEDKDQKIKDLEARLGIKRNQN